MMDFGEALNVLKAGGRVARKGWNGKGMWLVLVRPANSSTSPDAPRWWMSLHRDVQILLLPWIGMKTADGGFVPWLASQTDILATDWEQASGQ